MEFMEHNNPVMLGTIHILGQRLRKLSKLSKLV